MWICILCFGICSLCFLGYLYADFKENQKARREERWQILSLKIENASLLAENRRLHLESASGDAAAIGKGGSANR